MQINFTYTLKKLLACSTIFNSFYFIFILDLNKNIFVVIIILYSINYFLLMKTKWGKEDNNFIYFYSFYSFYKRIKVGFDFSVAQTKF